LCYTGKTIIAGLDPCQRLSGIALKLLAFEKLLHDYACYRDKVVRIYSI
jgi:trehalose 6-phosphate synthase/phosphatase